MTYGPSNRPERHSLVGILAAVLLSSHLLDGLELRAADPAPLPTRNYWLTCERLAGSAAPCVVMSWGEAFRYRVARETDAAR